MNVFFIGFMGSGKTTLGKRVAGELGLEFIDLDEFIETQEGMTIPQIFQNAGEQAFRLLENKALKQFSDLDGKAIATGGGAPCFHGNIDLMNTLGLTVYLKIKPGILASRLIHSHTERPLIKGKSVEELKEFVENKLNEREKYYSQARLTIEGDNIKASDIVTHIQTALDMDGIF